MFPPAIVMSVDLKTLKEPEKSKQVELPVRQSRRPCKPIWTW